MFDLNLEDYIILGRIILLSIIVSIILIFAMYTPFAIADWQECKILNNRAEQNYQWEYWTGCMVELNGIWYDTDNVYYTKDGTLILDD